MSQMFGIRYHGVINFNDMMKMDVVDLVSYQNSVSKKIQDADRNRFYNSITNWNKYYYNNEKTVKLRDLSHANTVMSDASHFRFLREVNWFSKRQVFNQIFFLKMAPGHLQLRKISR